MGVEGCRYLHTDSRGQEIPAVSNDQLLASTTAVSNGQLSASTTAVNNDQLKELIALVQAGLNLKDKTRSAPNVNSLVDFPGMGYAKSKSV